MKKRKETTDSVMSIPKTTKKSMEYHLNDCLKENSPDATIHHLGISHLKNDNSSKNITLNIVNLGFTVTNEVSEMINLIRNQKK